MQRANEIPALDRRKGTLFSSQADPLTKGIFAFVVIFTFVGLFVIGLGIRALMRSPGRRMVYIALLVSATMFTLGRIMDVSSLLLMYDWDTTMMQWNGVAMTSAVFYWWSEIIMYAAVLMLLWHRVASLENGHPGSGSECGKPKKILDGVLVGLFLILSLSRVVLVGSLNQWYTSLRVIGVKEFKHYRNGINISYALGHTTIVIFFLLLADIAITAFVLRSRISSVNKRDVPIERIVFIILPCIFVLFGLRFATTTYNHIDYTDQDRDPNIPVILDLIGIIIGSSVQVAVYAVLMLMTLKSAAWGTFGDQDFFQLREPGNRLPQQRRPEDDKASIQTT